MRCSDEERRRRSDAARASNERRTAAALDRARAALDVLETATAKQLAAELGRSVSQTQRALDVLAARGEVEFDQFWRERGHNGRKRAGWGRRVYWLTRSRIRRGAA